MIAPKTIARYLARTREKIKSDWEPVPRSRFPLDIWWCFPGGVEEIHKKRAAYRELEETLGSHLGEWENYPPRVVDEVIDLIDRTIEGLMARDPSNLQSK